MRRRHTKWRTNHAQSYFRVNERPINERAAIGRDDAVGSRDDSQEVTMASLKFICPNTRHQIDSGIETDTRAFHVIESQNLQMKCPCCGAIHCFPFREGLAADAVRGVAGEPIPRPRHV